VNNLFFSILKPNKGNIFLWINALILLAGIFIFGWPAEVVVLAYFFETIIIGLIHIVKMVWVFRYSRMQKIDYQKKGEMSAVVMIPFFAAHFFFFVFVQSTFLFGFILKNDPNLSSFNVFNNYAYVLTKPNMPDALFVIVVMNIGMVLRNFFMSGKYNEYSVPKMFMQPYLRIIIQQFAVILTGFFFFFLNGAIVAAVFLIIFRLILDLLLYAVVTNSLLKASLVKVLVKKQPGSTAEEIQDGVEAFLN